VTAPEHPTAELPPEASDRTFGSVVAGLILVAIGVVWMLGALDVIEVRLSMILPLALTIVGAALMAGAFRGSHPALVGMGVFLTVVTLLASFLPDSFRGGIGDRVERPAAVAELQERYDLAFGEITIDLSGLDLTESKQVEVSVFAGQINVVVPPGIPYRVEASAGAGEIHAGGEVSEGLTPRLQYTSPGFDTAAVTLTLDLQVGAGEIEVRE
jgi:hypothetical protein